MGGRFAGAGRLTATAAAMAFALTWPALFTWLYFVALASGGGDANPLQQLTYAVGKCVQFGFPVVFFCWSEGRLPRPGRPRLEGLALGLAFGLGVAAAILALYFGALRHSPDLARTPEQVRHKLEELGASSTAGFLLLAAFVVVAHSLLEEYYWRWFVFGRLRTFLPQLPAVVLSSLGFMAHHVIVLHVYLPGRFGSRVVPFALAVAAGGAVWAWLYERTHSIYAPWLSHLLVDAAIFVIGWDLMRGG